MRCEACGKTGARVHRVTRSYGTGAKLLLVEDVPVVRCSHCGESYVTAPTLRELERIKLHRRSVGKKRNVPVATFT